MVFSMGIFSEQMMKKNEEMFEVIDDQGIVIGLAPRSQCHGNPSLLHRAVHIFVLTSNHELIMQQRGLHKDVEPGKWDTSAGGHVAPGEPVELAALRELHEELGIANQLLKHLYEYRWRSSRESELINTYHLIYDGPCYPHPDEVYKIDKWPLAEIDRSLGTGVFTPNFEFEWRHYYRPHIGA